MTMAKNISVSEQAALAFGQTKEEEVETVAHQDMYDVAFDSPKDLWDALGHVQIKRYVPSGALIEEWGNILLVWQQAREAFADVIQAARAEGNRATDAQVTLVQQLASQTGTPVNVDQIKQASKSDVSNLIQAMKQQVASTQPQATVTGTPQTVQPLGPAPTVYGGGGAGGISASQVNYITILCKKKGLQVPPNIMGMKSSEASQLISQLKST